MLFASVIMNSFSKTYTMNKLNVILFASLLTSVHQSSQASVYTQLHKHIYKINDQYFYGEKVHTYLLELEDKILLFDIPTYSDKLKKFILSFNKPVFAILSHGSCGIDIEVIHTPGHSAGSICVLDKSTKSLFTGDTFYGDKNGNIRDMTKERQSYYENLEDRIKSCKSNYDFENVYPFHYEIIENTGKEALETFLTGK